MDRKLVDRVLNHLDRGNEVFFSSDHVGSVHIKVKHGPFNALTAHYQTDQATYDVIHQAISPEAEYEEYEEYEEYSACGEPLKFTGQLASFAAPPPAPIPTDLPASEPSHEPMQVHQPHPRPPEVCAKFANQLSQRDGIAGAEWKAYSKTYRSKREDQRLQKRIEAEEIETHRFALATVDGSWDDLLSGQIAPLAEEIWRGMDPAKSVHVLADEVHVPLRECLFWLCVFKRYLGVWVDNEDGTYVFNRPADEPDLHAALALSRHPPPAPTRTGSA